MEQEQGEQPPAGDAADEKPSQEQPMDQDS